MKRMILTAHNGSPSRASWGAVLLGLGLALAALAGLYRDSLWAMIETWNGSETYAHGYLILPISLWLTWEQRAALRTAMPQPTLLPVLLMLPIGLLWLVAQLVDVRVAQEYSVVALLILATWTMIGTPVARRLAFPLLFLLLAVPVGDWLTHPLMNFTADFTVSALQLTGVPVYRDGTFFSLPTGDWSVVEECSGIRYVLASVTLGLLYAYLTYSKLWKRILFVAASALVPVLANGVRAYMIVMIGHLSGMKLATGVDHLIYGWVFFGIVIAIMFAVGALWRDPEPEPMPPQSATKTGLRPVVAGAGVVLAGAIWPLLLALIDSDAKAPIAAVQVRPPTAQGEWRGESASHWSWRPAVLATDGESYAFYRAGQTPVGLYLGIYRRQREGAEVVNMGNQMAPTSDPDWSDKEVTRRDIRTPAGLLRVEQHRLAARRAPTRLLVWTWYRIGSVDTSNPYVAKFVEAAYRLTGRPPTGTLIAVATRYQEDTGAAAKVLESFLAELWSAIGAEIDTSIARGPGT